jgi:hypothetical protein
MGKNRRDDSAARQRNAVQDHRRPQQWLQSACVLCSNNCGIAICEQSIRLSPAVAAWRPRCRCGSKSFADAASLIGSVSDTVLMVATRPSSWRGDRIFYRKGHFARSDTASSLNILAPTTCDRRTRRGRGGAGRPFVRVHRREQVRRKRMPIRWCRSQKPAKSTASAFPVAAVCHPTVLTLIRRSTNGSDPNEYVTPRPPRSSQALALPRG